MPLQMRDRSIVPATRDWRLAVKRGLFGTCPNCGKGKLFSGYLTLAPRCERCGLDYDFAEAGDGPAVFVILVTGFIIVGAALIVPGRASADPVLFLVGSRGDPQETSAEPTPPGGGLTSGGTSTSHLGSFQIIINAGAGLAANLPALAAFQRAAAQWESRIADPVTVNVNANLAPLGAGILGSTSSVNLLGDYPTIRGAMIIDAANEADDGIVASLPASMSFAMPAGFAQDASGGSPLIQLSKANAKALGFGGLDGLFGASDGSITFSSGFTFDFDNSDGVTAGAFDFESVAAHELGHLLGFLSDVDYIDFRRSQGQTANDVEPTTLDMFRFDNGGVNDPATAADFSFMPRSMVPGNDEVFDQVNAAYGLTEGRMSTGLTQGDGRQASHWKDNLGLGLMDPTLGTGEISPIALTDWRAFDLIGYDIAIVPETGAWMFGAVATCVAGAGGAGRRFRRS